MITKAAHNLSQSATAGEIMGRNPISIRRDATLEDALILLVDRGLSAVPVIDDAGKPLGVLSRYDILVHQRQKVGAVAAAEGARVADLMTPTVFAVTPNTSILEVIDQLLGLRVHRLFVVDNGTLIGVVSILDVLTHLRGQEPKTGRD